MNLDEDVLRELIGELRGEIRHMKVAQANRPIADAMVSQLGMFVTQLVPDLIATPNARVRESVVRLEELNLQGDDHRHKLEEEIESSLKIARAKTNALTQWLEALS